MNNKLYLGITYHQVKNNKYSLSSLPRSFKLSSKTASCRPRKRAVMRGAASADCSSFISESMIAGRWRLVDWQLPCKQAFNIRQMFSTSQSNCEQKQWEPITQSTSPQNKSTVCETWWLSGKFGALCPEGPRF